MLYCHSFALIRSLSATLSFIPSEEVCCGEESCLLALRISSETVCLLEFQASKNSASWICGGMDAG